MSASDEMVASPLDLLARYRKLCEAVGAARASGAPVPREAREQLERVEGELRTRLWLATTAEPHGQKQESQLRLPGGASHNGEAPPGETILEQQTVSRSARVAATVHTDGACIGNPGPGGYGVVVRVPGHPERELSGGKPRTTNNEMEMTAAVVGVKLAISLGATEINVVSDSQYLVKGMTQWLRGWLRNGWKTSTGTPVKNRALWEGLHDLTRGRKVTWSWTPGHAGDPHNERCDTLAVAAAEAAARLASNPAVR